MFGLSRPVSRLAVIGIVALVSIFSYQIAHAGLFSFMESVIEGTPVSAKTVNTSEKQITSQNITLLQAAANIDPNPSKPGDILPISGNALVPDIAASNESETTMNTEISTYLVREGDTISGVAKMFGVSVNTILWANNLTGKSVLKAGRTLIILPVSGITYTVKKGDTVGSIAKKYKSDEDDILTYNDLHSSSGLIAGDTIIIPNAEITVSVPTRIVYANNPAHDTNGPNYAGYYIRPVSGGVKSQNIHGYNAIDIAHRVGTPILASASGVVIVSKIGGWNGGYGNFIIISHPNGTQTLYSHLSKNVAGLGSYVSQGQTIGLMGATGKATGSHLHFEIRGAKNPF